MDKATFVTRVKQGRAEWDALLAQIDERRLTEPGVAGDWSMKDIIAHVAWHEREMIGLLRARALVGSDLWDRPLDERNAAIYEMNRHRPLPEVLAEARQTFQEFVDALQSISDEDLNDARRFRDMPEEWQPWDLIAGNSYNHYLEHLPAIRAWLNA